MERRRTDRQKQLEVVLGAISWYFFAHSQLPITSISCHDTISPRHNLVNCPSIGPGTKVLCGNTVNQIPLFVTKEILSGHEVFLGLLFAAVNKLARGVLSYLEKAELREQDVWLRSDYRQAEQTVLLAFEGCADPYTKAFIQLHAIHPSKVTSWWRDRAKLLYLAETTNCPTPLLVANRVEEVFQIIPDYDPTLGGQR